MHAAVMDYYKRFGIQERYASTSHPSFSPGQLSPSSSQCSPVSPHGSPLSPNGSPLSSHLWYLPPQLSPAVSPQLSPSRELPRLSDRQLSVLEESFRRHRNPRRSDLMLLAVELQLDEPHIKRWFGHRLACWRQEQGLQPNGRTVDMM